MKDTTLLDGANRTPYSNYLSAKELWPVVNSTTIFAPCGRINHFVARIGCYRYAFQYGHINLLTLITNWALNQRFLLIFHLQCADNWLNTLVAGPRG